MSNQIAKITQSAKSVIRVVKSVGPLIISQSESASESFASHQLRLAKVDAARERTVMGNDDGFLVVRPVGSVSSHATDSRFHRTVSVTRNAR